MQNQHQLRQPLPPAYKEEMIPEGFFQEEEIHLSEYIDILTKRKTLIILFFILSVSITAVFTLRAVPIYESTAQMLIEDEKGTSLISGQMMGMMFGSSETRSFNTHLVLLNSRPVIKEVIKIMSLDEMGEEKLEINPVKKILRQFKDKIIPFLEFLSGRGLTGNSPLTDATTERMNRLIKGVQGKIDIQAVEATQLLTITVQDKDPKMAADIANVLAREYIRFNLFSRVESSKDSLEWLKKELYQLKKKLEKDERTFYEYRQQTGLFSMEGKQMVVSQKVAEFNTMYLNARNNRMSLDSRIEELDRHLRSSRSIARVRSLNNNPLIQNIYSNISNLEIQQNKLAKVYKAKHPKMVQLKSEMDKSKKRLSEELVKELANLKSQRKVLKSSEAVLKQTLSEFQEDQLGTSGKELEYIILQRNVLTSQNLYDMMLTRVKESDILMTSDTTNIRIMSEATVNSIPVLPNKKRKLLFGMVLGLIGGMGLAFLLEYLDQSIRTEEDVQDLLGLPVLSRIPEAGKKAGYGNTYGAQK